MHTFNHIVRSQSNRGRIGRSNAFGATMILALLAAVGVGLSVFASDPGFAAKPADQVTGIEDWHGNVAASGR